MSKLFETNFSKIFGSIQKKSWDAFIKIISSEFLFQAENPK